MALLAGGKLSDPCLIIDLISLITGRMAAVTAATPEEIARIIQDALARQAKGLRQLAARRAYAGPANKNSRDQFRAQAQLRDDLARVVGSVDPQRLAETLGTHDPAPEPWPGPVPPWFPLSRSLASLVPDAQIRAGILADTAALDAIQDIVSGTGGGTAETIEVIEAALRSAGRAVPCVADDGHDPGDAADLPSRLVRS